MGTQKNAIEAKYKDLEHKFLTFQKQEQSNLRDASDKAAKLLLVEAENSELQSQVALLSQWKTESEMAIKHLQESLSKNQESLTLKE